ncbi:ADP-ribosylation/Crystallin J1 [Mycena olivaceomarginata]|nr:ADP-ribosylation/Crystallin J1 [Mycena olivaceomarginata]
MSLTPLHLQPLAPATPHTKIRLAQLAKALCHALCGPVEFHPRFKTPFVAHMAPNDNFGLPAGMWTDNTSMTPALARSITRGKGGMDAADQLDAYYRWWRAGELSTTGGCFDIRNTIQRARAVRGRAMGTVDAPCSVLRALFTRSDQEWRRKAAAAVLPRITRDLSGSVFGRNGSLMRMRVLPVGLTYWRKEEGKVGDLARESSGMTHPNVVCQEACAAWATCIVRAHYAAHHRLLCLAVATLHASTAATAEDGITNPNADTDDLVEAHALAVLPQDAALPSSGYIVHMLAAALYVFLATSTFEAGVLLTANMGDDADTVMTMYGGLVGTWYAIEEDSGKQAGARVAEHTQVKHRAVIVVGDLSEADVVCDCADRDDNFVGEVYGVEASFDPGQRQGGTVRLGEQEAVAVVEAR